MSCPDPKDLKNLSLEAENQQLREQIQELQWRNSGLEAQIEFLAHALEAAQGTAEP